MASFASSRSETAPERAVNSQVTNGRVEIGVAGTGAMGRHHVRLLSGMTDARLVGVYDVDRAVARSVAEEFDCRAFDTLAELADACDAVVVAAPTEAHLEVASEAADRGCHLLVEKPLARTVEEGRAIADAGDGRVVAVGHVEFYNPAMQHLLALGRSPRYVEVQRRSGFTRRSLDIDVIRDVMIHDLQLLHEFAPGPVTEIRALGTAALSDSVDIANARLEFSSGLVANLTASRVSVQRERQMRVFFPELYCSLDFDAMTMTRYQVVTGDDGELKLENDVIEGGDVNPLEQELAAFVAACRGEDCEIVGVEAGLEALQTAQAISEVIERNLSQA